MENIIITDQMTHKLTDFLKSNGGMQRIPTNLLNGIEEESKILNEAKANGAIPNIDFILE